MNINQHELYVATPPGSDTRASLRRFFAELAPHDWLVFGYFIILNFAVLHAPASAARNVGFANVFALLLLHVTITTLVRTRSLTHAFWAPFLYRLAAWGCVQITYFLFASLLPVVNSNALDHHLLNFDLTVFGFEPALFFDRFVTPVTTEWFAFFYFGYFFVLALHVLPILFLTRNERLLGEFGLGMLLLFCCGHTLYMLVPGYGPYKAMPEVFQHHLPPGVWWSMTAELVARSGAQKDIFPSLHTAAPTFILLFAFRHRRRLPFRYSWPVLAFFVANIITATMFLRWHYVIDVVAGLSLALFAHVASIRVTRWDNERRAALGLAPAWPRWTIGAAAEPSPHEVPVPGE